MLSGGALYWPRTGLQPADVHRLEREQGRHRGTLAAAQQTQSTGNHGHTAGTNSNALTTALPTNRDIPVMSDRALHRQLERMERAHRSIRQRLTQAKPVQRRFPAIGWAHHQQKQQQQEQGPAHDQLASPSSSPQQQRLSPRRADPVAGAPIPRTGEAAAAVTTATVTGTGNGLMARQRRNAVADLSMFLPPPQIIAAHAPNGGTDGDDSSHEDAGSSDMLADIDAGAFSDDHDDYHEEGAAQEIELMEDEDSMEMDDDNDDD